MANTALYAPHGEISLEITVHFHHPTSLGSSILERAHVPWAKSATRHEGAIRLHCNPTSTCETVTLVTALTVVDGIKRMIEGPVPGLREIERGGIAGKLLLVDTHLIDLSAQECGYILQAGLWGSVEFP